MSLLIHLPILFAVVLSLLIVDLPLSHAQSIDELKVGVVKITAAVAGQHRFGTGFIVRIEDEAACIVTASHVVEGAALAVNFYTNPDYSPACVGAIERIIKARQALLPYQQAIELAQARERGA